MGNILNLERGVGRDLLKGAASVGLAYYATYKLSRKTLYGFVTMRYQWELAARTTTEGGAWNVLATFVMKPIKTQQP